MSADCLERSHRARFDYPSFPSLYNGVVRKYKLGKFFEFSDARRLVEAQLGYKIQHFDALRFMPIIWAYFM
jgi:hypothetical protein